VVGASDQAGAGAALDDLALGAAHIQVDPDEASEFTAGEFAGDSAERLRLLTPDLGDQRLLAFGVDEAATGGVATARDQATDIDELGEEDVRCAGFCHDAAKDRVGDIFHRREDEDRFLEALPDMRHRNSLTPR